jgi:hypothetical protein
LAHADVQPDAVAMADIRLTSLTLGRRHLQQACRLAHTTPLIQRGTDTLHLERCRPWPTQALA